MPGKIGNTYLQSCLTFVTINVKDILRDFNYSIWIPRWS